MLQSGEAVELRIRHDDPKRCVGHPETLVLARNGGDGKPFIVGQPIVAALTWSAGTMGERGGMPKVTVDWDGQSTDIDVVATLAERLPGPWSKVERVRVRSDGITRRTQVFDADDGDPITPYFGVKVEMAAGGQCLAWVDVIGKTPP